MRVKLCQGLVVTCYGPSPLQNCYANPMCWHTLGGRVRVANFHPPPIWPDLKSPHFTLSLHSFPSLGLHHCRQPRSRPPPSTDDISVTGSKRIRQRGGQHLCQVAIRARHRWHIRDGMENLSIKGAIYGPTISSVMASSLRKMRVSITDNVFLRHGWGLWSVIDERFRSSGSNQQRYRRRRCIIFNQSPANQIR